MYPVFKNFFLALTLSLSGLGFAENLGRRIISDDYKFDGNPNVKVAFFDADSTLRVAPSGSVSANSGRDVWLLPQVTTEMERLNQEGYFIAIVSNQGGIPKNVSLEDADEALDRVRRMSRWLNPKAIIHYYDFAENRDHDRKPQTGMLERVEQKLQEKFGAAVKVDRANSFMCGDSAYTSKETMPDGRPGSDFSNSDRLVAENFGIRFVDPADFFQWRKYGYDRIHKKAQIDEFFERNPSLIKPAPGPCPITLRSKIQP